MGRGVPFSLSRSYGFAATLFGCFGVAALMVAVLLLGLLALVDSIAPSLTARRLGDSAREADLSTPARRAAWMASVARDFETPTASDEEPGWIGFPTGIRHPASVCWVSEDGTVLASTSPRHFWPGTSVGSRLTPPEREASTRLLAGGTQEHGRVFAGPFLAGARTIDAHGKQRGFVFLRSEGRFEIDEAFDFVWSSRMALGLVLLLPLPIVGSALGSRFARRWHDGLASVTNTVALWRAGDLDARMPASPVTELTPLVDDLDRLADGLRQRERLRQRLASAEARATLAESLHDSVKQRLFAANLHLAAASNLVEKGRPEVLAIDWASSAVRGALEELSALIEGNEHPLSTASDLASRLRLLAASVGDEFGIRVELRVEEFSLGPESDEELYGIAREATMNAIRHSGSKEIAITLTQELGSYRLRVRDGGRGFEVGQSEGFGLRSIAERTRRIPGARLFVESTPGQGTSVIVEGPI